MSQERWEAFLTKVTARAEEICAEADPGFDALIAAEVMDPVPLASAMSEFHARMMGLEKKIDESWDKLGLDDDGLREQGRQLRKRIERQSKALQVTKSAKAARAVQKLAQAEMAKPVQCSSCGGPLEPTVRHEASNVTCPHCKAVSVVRPGMATLMLYGGGRLHAFGEEAALEESVRLEAAVERWHAAREKRKSDVDAYTQAHRSYWLAYARGYGACVPGWSEAKSKELAEAKLGFLKYELERTRTED
jgi:predicted RNA-binding Zn-ribbon protein involved in translation (DUF1610 family)